MNTVTYRNIAEKDFVECAQVFLEVFGPQGCGQPWTAEKCLQAVRHYSAHPEFCFVAEAEGKIVGFVLAGPNVRETGRELYIDELGVLTGYQGQGIGKTLLSKIREACKQDDIFYLRLLADPKYPSYDWYQKMGMELSGWVELKMAV